MSEVTDRTRQAGPLGIIDCYVHPFPSDGAVAFPHSCESANLIGGVSGYCLWITRKSAASAA
jgi:hypothetical protein